MTSRNIKDKHEENETKDLLIYFATLCLLGGIGITIFFFSELTRSVSVHIIGAEYSLTNVGAIGDFIAGIVGTLFSLASFFLLYVTLKDQRDNFKTERLENNFFEMLKFHRDNVGEMQFAHYLPSKNKEELESRKVFKTILSQFNDAWLELKVVFEQYTVEQIYDTLYLEELRKNPQLRSRDIDCKQFAQIDITYLIVFFGLGKDDKLTIIDLCSKKYDIKFVQKVIQYASMKPKCESKYWGSWVNVNQLDLKVHLFSDIQKRRDDNSYDESSMWLNAYFYPDEYQKFYGGHQFRLDHYFRHIFQTVKFIDEATYISDYDKYKYVKILRGQLSNYEQIVFFINSLSALGRTWELVKKTNADKEILESEQLISKYDLIKNIPKRFICDDIDILRYYPKLNLEVIKHSRPTHNLAQECSKAL